MIDKRLVILLFAYGNFWSAVCISLQAPFFPREAERKGAAASEYGLVFGIYELGIVILSPLFGKLTGHVRTESMISLGLLVVGVAVVSFGFLDRAPDGRPFVALALGTRLVESVGCTLFNVFNFTAVAALYPDSIASSFSILQTGYGVGLLAGPTIGALLYNLGGFTLPFLALGSFLIIGAGLSFLLLPAASAELNKKHSASGSSRDADRGAKTASGAKTTATTKPPPQEANKGLWTLVANFSCALNLASIIATFSFIGFNAAALEPHLRQFGLSVVVVGFVFIIDGGVFAVSSPLVGRLCDKGAPPKLLILGGHLVSALGISLLGPLAIIPLDSSLPLVLIALSLIGLGVSLKFVPAFFNTLREAVERRQFPDDKRTYALVTSLVYSCGSLGSFVGPSLGGYLFEHFGYRASSCVFVFVELLLFIVALAYQLFCAPIADDTYGGKQQRHRRQNYLGDASVDIESSDIDERRLLISSTDDNNKKSNLCLSLSFDGYSLGDHLVKAKAPNSQQITS